MADGLGTTRDSQGYSDCQGYSDMGSPWLTVSGQPGAMADGLGTTRDSQGYSDCQGYSDMGSPWLTVSGQLGTVRVTVTVRDTLTWVVHG